MYELFETMFDIIQKGYEVFKFKEIPRIIDSQYADPSMGNLVTISMFDIFAIQQRFLDSFVFEINAPFQIDGRLDNIDHAKQVSMEFLMILMNYKKCIDSLTQSDVLIVVESCSTIKRGQTGANFNINGTITRIVNYYKSVPLVDQNI